MNDSTSQYYANPVSVTGQINAGSNVAKILLNPAFLATQGGVLTGAVGLPISKIQINASSNPNNSGYIAPIGAIAVTQAGDATTGYPEFSVNLTSVYRVKTGWLKGFYYGGSSLSQWKLRQYYYYPAGFSLGADRGLDTWPVSTTLNGIFGYERKFGRFLWSTQINIANMFNHYHVVLTPDAINGYKNLNSINATWTAQPRFYSWTNRIDF